MERDPPEGAEGDSATYRMAGSITIARAASTAREIAAEPDPLTIDLSAVRNMDTVGAWVVYRTVRDRKAKVVGANDQAKSLLEQVAEADHPARSAPKNAAASAAFSASSANGCRKPESRSSACSASSERR